MGKEKPPGERWVSTPHDMIDSAAFKMLSDAAQALFTQLRRQWRCDELGRPFFILPYAHVQYRWGFQRFKQARQELLDLGFVDLKAHGGIAQPGGAKCAVYAPSERWREISSRILVDPAHGRVVWRRFGSRRVSTWEPLKRKGHHIDNISSYNRRRGSGGREQP